jgi:hypothetical protein
LLSKTKKSIDPYKSTTGFHCINEENAENGCEDYQVSFCCPDLTEGQCVLSGYVWGEFMSKDDPAELGDLELKTAFSEYEVCDGSLAIKVKYNLYIRVPFYYKSPCSANFAWTTTLRGTFFKNRFFLPTITN